MNAEMTPSLALKLAIAVESMPAFAESVRKILTLSQDINCSPKDLVQVIAQDPVITVKILRTVNSAYYSLPQRMTSINHAVVYLGFNTVKNLALAIAAIGVLPQQNAAGFDVHQYLVHSLATAGIAKQLAGRCQDIDPFDCFIAGLLHDFGKIVFAQFKPNEFRIALEISRDYGDSLHLALRKVIGIDHAAVGAMLTRKWNFSDQLVETIHHQYGPEVKDTGIIACVFAANQISKRMGFGFAGNACIEELPAVLERRLGGSLDTLTTSLGDFAPMLRDAQLIAQLHGSL